MSLIFAIILKGQKYFFKKNLKKFGEIQKNPLNCTIFWMNCFQ